MAAAGVCVALAGHEWRFAYLSDYQRRNMTAMQAFRLGMLSTDELAQRVEREFHLRHRRERSVALKRAAHVRALGRGEDDPTKPDYSKFIAKKKGLVTKIKPLSHGLYVGPCSLRQHADCGTRSE